MKLLLVLLLFFSLCASQTFTREQNQSWLLIINYPANCSMLSFATITTTTDTFCRMAGYISTRWFVSESDALKSLNDNSDPDIVIIGLYHIDHETTMIVSEYQVAVKQPDKVERKKKYVKR